MRRLVLVGAVLATVGIVGSAQYHSRSTTTSPARKTWIQSDQHDPLGEPLPHRGARRVRRGDVVNRRHAHFVRSGVHANGRLYRQLRLRLGRRHRRQRVLAGHRDRILRRRRIGFGRHDLQRDPDPRSRRAVLAGNLLHAGRRCRNGIHRDEPVGRLGAVYSDGIQGQRQAGVPTGFLPRPVRIGVRFSGPSDGARKPAVGILLDVQMQGQSVVVALEYYGRGCSGLEIDNVTEYCW
jgi:hypothetical protein